MDSEHHHTKENTMIRMRHAVAAAVVSGGLLATAAGTAQARTLLQHGECTVSTSQSTENPVSDQGFRDPVTGTSYLPGTGPIGEVTCNDVVDPLIGP
jgi:hypothetical protein